MFAFGYACTEGHTQHINHISEYPSFSNFIFPHYPSTFHNRIVYKSNQLYKSYNVITKVRCLREQNTYRKGSDIIERKTEEFSVDSESKKNISKAGERNFSLIPIKGKERFLREHLLMDDVQQTRL